MEDNNKLGMGIDDEVKAPQIEEMYTPPHSVDLNKQAASQNTQQSSVPVYGQPQNGTNPYNGVSYGNQGNMQYGQAQNGQPNNAQYGNTPNYQQNPYNQPQYGQNPYGQPQTPYGQPVTGTFDNYDVMREKGRKLALGIAIAYMVIAGINILGAIIGFSDNPAKSVGRIIGSILNIYFAYCFMNGGNKTRLFFGITSIISAVLYILMLLIFGGVMSSVTGLGALYTTIMLIIMLPFLGFSGFVTWATLFNKNVKAFCGAL